MFICICIYVHIYMYICTYIYIYIYKYLKHENDLTPSPITTQFYFGITLYIFFSALKLGNF